MSPARPCLGSKSAHLCRPLQREHPEGVCTRLISIPSTTARQDSLALRERDPSSEGEGHFQGHASRTRTGRKGWKQAWSPGPRILFGAPEFAKCFSQTLSSPVLLPLGPQPIQTPPRAALSSTVATTHSRALETWLVQVQMCCKHKTHTGFQRLSMEKRI